MPLGIMVVSIVLIWVSMGVHDDFGQIQELLPKGYRCGSTGRDRVLLGHLSRPLVNIVKIRFNKLTLPLIMYPYIGLIVDFPAPPVIVHRPQRHVLAVKQVYLGMQHSLSSLID